ncbi:uncharacterized protein PAC_16245 [Phialocephala subalpina]|uniref:DUF676 domain-containing protein n=1 Tax=Phialocephala subalpina TaxID=576137 RepID=A0A1L7XMV9_9HELO|nr:uncharacterized protein PAC_16245 [Phialocephala subalpina]
MSSFFNSIRNKIREEKFGLFLFHNVGEEQVELVITCILAANADINSIIAVHGLGGNWKQTWTDENKALWLRDILPLQLPEARIMSYGYNSRTAFSKGITNINDEAEIFLSALNGKRQTKDQKTRPIIFIAHSLGGIVVKKALILAHEQPERYADLSKSVRGVIFFGVPHRGSDVAYWGTFAANLLETIQLGFGTNSNFVKDLQRNSETLANISEQFFPLGDKLKIRTFYETERLLNRVIVDKNSACLNHPNEIAVGIAGANHRSICKFSHGNSEKYSLVWMTIKQLVDAAVDNSVTSSPRLYAQESISTKVCFTVPFDKDPKFLGREDVITEIDEQFKVQRRVALAGIGGVGKSQIAIEYCHRFREQHPRAHVFWVHAGSSSRMDQGYKSIAESLNLPGWDNASVDTFRLVSTALSGDAHGHWLLVLDNADDMDTFDNARLNPSSVDSNRKEPLINYLPRGSNGMTLITTRDTQAGKSLANNRKVIEVSPMTTTEAESLLQLNVSEEGNLDNPEYRELVEILGCLPLAITQAGAFIDYNKITAKEYLEILCANDSEMEELLKKELPDFRRDSESQNSVIRTWKVSFDRIRQRWTRAADMLCLMAFLDRQAIPKTLLQRKGEKMAEFVDALGKLKAFSLVSTGKGDTLEIHRLVQISTRTWLALWGDPAKWQEEALKVLAAAFPPGDFANWSSCQVLSPHAQTVTQYSFGPDLGLLRAKLLHNMASYDEERGRYGLAYMRASDALSIRGEALGHEHHDTLMSMFYVGRLLWRQGKYKDAEETYMKLLELRKRVLGPEHPDTLMTMTGIGISLWGQGKYEAAEEMHRQTLELREKVLGLEHPDTLISMNNLGNSLSNQGKYKAAEKMHRQTLELREKVLGPEHPDTLGSMNNLGTSLSNQGKHKAAEEMRRQTLELQEKVLGPEHPNTLINTRTTGEGAWT